LSFSFLPQRTPRAFALLRPPSVLARILRERQLSVISVRSMRLVASGKNSKRSIQNTPSANVSRGNLSKRKRTSSGLPRVLRKRNCRRNRLTNYSKINTLTKVRAEIRSVRRWLRAEELPLIWPLATGYIPTAAVAFGEQRKRAALCQRLAATPLTPERSSRAVRKQ
jgi:hypothetical protein